VKTASVLLCAILSSCSFFERANEFKGHGRIDLLFPFDLIPGLESVLPRIALDIKGGFEWHNDAEQHQFEMDKLRLGVKEIDEENDDWTVREVFLNTLRFSDADVVQHNY